MKNHIITNKNEIVELLEEHKQLACVFSDKFGIINALMERKELSEYGLYMFQSLSADIRVLNGASKDVSSGGLGIDFDKERALCSCFGEALERYSMSFAKDNNSRKCHISELPSDLVNDDFTLYDELEYTISPVSFLKPKEDIITWVKIKSVNVEGKEIYWPAGLIYLPYDEKIIETTSTGLAAADNIAEAISSGLMEVIERDALVLNFYLNMEMDELLIDSVSGKNRDFLKKIQKKYNVKIYKLKTDIGMPVFYSLIWTGKGKKIHFGIGASANLDSDIALAKSLKECLFTYFYSKNIMDLKKDDKNRIDALYEHFLYYQGEKFEELLHKGNEVPYEHQEFSLDVILEKLNANGYNAYYVELTTSDVEKAGINVVRVVIPGYVDVNKTHILPYKGSKRYYSFAKKMGIKCENLNFSNPHPFP